MTAKPLEPVVGYPALGRTIDPLDILRTHHCRTVGDFKTRIMCDAWPSCYSWLQETPAQGTAKKNKKKTSHLNRNHQHEKKPLEQIMQPSGKPIKKKAHHLLA